MSQKKKKTLKYLRPREQANKEIRSLGRAHWKNLTQVIVSHITMQIFGVE
jgi:hypothetical protein